LRRTAASIWELLVGSFQNPGVGELEHEANSQAQLAEAVGRLFEIRVDLLDEAVTGQLHKGVRHCLCWEEFAVRSGLFPFGLKGRRISVLGLIQDLTDPILKDLSVAKRFQI